MCALPVDWRLLLCDNLMTSKRAIHHTPEYSTTHRSSPDSAALPRRNRSDTDSIRTGRKKRNMCSECGKGMMDRQTHATAPPWAGLRGGGLSARWTRLVALASPLTDIFPLGRNPHGHNSHSLARGKRTKSFLDKIRPTKITRSRKFPFYNPLYKCRLHDCMRL